MLKNSVNQHILNSLKFWIKTTPELDNLSNLHLSWGTLFEHHISCSQPIDLWCWFLRTQSVSVKTLNDVKQDYQYELVSRRTNLVLKKQQKEPNESHWKILSGVAGFQSMTQPQPYKSPEDFILKKDQKLLKIFFLVDTPFFLMKRIYNCHHFREQYLNGFLNNWKRNDLNSALMDRPIKSIASPTD